MFLNFGLFKMLIYCIIILQLHGSQQLSMSIDFAGKTYWFCT